MNGKRILSYLPDMLEQMTEIINKNVAEELGLVFGAQHASREGKCSTGRSGQRRSPLWHLAYGCSNSLVSGPIAFPASWREGGGWAVPHSAIDGPRSFLPKYEYQNVRETSTAHYGAKTHGMLLKRQFWPYRRLLHQRRQGLLLYPPSPQVRPEERKSSFRRAKNTGPQPMPNACFGVFSSSHACAQLSSRFTIFFEHFTTGAPTKKL